MNRFFVLCALLCAGCDSQSGEAGQSAPYPPIQQALRTQSQITKAGWDLQPMASFQVEARVLATAHYHFSEGAELAPVDLALGWGPMSDPSVLEHIHITQRQRFYYWSVAYFPIPREDIIQHSANMHLIPATPAVEQQLLDIKAEDLVTLEGLLVNARAADGRKWLTSLVRSDVGDGACELVLVASVRIRS